MLIIHFVLQESQMVSQKMLFPGGQVSYLIFLINAHLSSRIELQQLVD